MTRLPRRAKAEAFARLFEDDFGDVDHLINEENVIEGEEEQLDEGLDLDDDGDPLPVEMLEVMPGKDCDYSDSDEDDEILPLRQRIESNKVENNDQNVEDAWQVINEDDHIRGKIPAKNICRFEPGPKTGIHPTTEKESLQIFLEDIIEELVRYTNLAGRRMVAACNLKKKRHCTWKPVSQSEMEAFLGLHLIAGAYRAHHRQVKDLWSDVHGQPIFRATMSEDRFKAIKRCFRMDDPARRDRLDKLAPVRYVWDLLQKSLTAAYTPGPYLTVDEQLLEFHGRVAFRQYIKTKPGKFGVKIFWINDSSSSYALRGIVYTGSQTLENKTTDEPFSQSLTLKLTEPFTNENRNVTCDNWFTSVPLAKKLLEKKTTLLGTIRSNRKFIPKEAKSNEGRSKKSVKYYKKSDMILCSYMDKGNQPVLLLTTMHGEVSKEGEDKQPQIVRDYNATKSGTDNMDHMIRVFSCKRKCRRWPYSFFMNMLDVMTMNAYVIFKHDYSETNR